MSSTPISFSRSHSGRSRITTRRRRPSTQRRAMTTYQRTMKRSLARLSARPFSHCWISAAVLGGISPDFHSLGHKATGLDRLARLLEIARTNSGCEVLLQNLLELSLPADRYDGVFANGSLFHVPTQEIPRVLGDLHRSLVDRGVLFCSNPCGSDAEGFYGNRFGAFHRADTWCARVSDCGFVEVARYGWPKDAPADPPPWLATIFRKL